jgi:hypothetical protein
MKELLSYSTNTYVIVLDGKLRTEVEIAFILSEPEYRLSSDSQIVRERTATTVRWASTPENLRVLAAKFVKTADDAEAEVRPWITPVTK